MQQCNSLSVRSDVTATTAITALNQLISPECDCDELRCQMETFYCKLFELIVLASWCITTLPSSRPFSYTDEDHVRWEARESQGFNFFKTKMAMRYYRVHFLVRSPVVWSGESQSKFPGEVTSCLGWGVTGFQFHQNEDGYEILQSTFPGEVTSCLVWGVTGFQFHQNEYGYDILQSKFPGEVTSCLVWGVTGFQFHQNEDGYEILQSKFPGEVTSCLVWGVTGFQFHQNEDGYEILQSTFPGGTKGCFGLRSQRVPIPSKRRRLCDITDDYIVMMEPLVV
ncbi:hypothetical protein J6590_052502 [Homalodisca vitripennis]|nr:hypothetical protein J6590_052502 [Homalodisca vitripennis]